MTTPPNPFDDLMKLSQDWAATMGQAASAFTPEALEKIWPTMPKEAMDAFMGKGMNPDGLDAKSRLMLTLQGLVIQGAVAEPQVRLTIRHLREAGATDQEILETIALGGVFGGAPAAAKAMQLYQEVTEASP
ncbi:MAG: carboxymuconolactone decarboxylase family protein [Pseudomonadota bacterium]